MRTSAFIFVTLLCGVALAEAHIGFEAKLHTDAHWGPGAEVTDMYATGKARYAGITPGSRIESVDKIVVKHPKAIADYCKKKKPGDIVWVTVRSNGELEAVRIELVNVAEMRKGGFLGRDRGGVARAEAHIGFEAVIDKQWPWAPCIRVEDFYATGKARASGLVPGDVIKAVDRVVLNDPKTIANYCKRKKPGDVVVVTVSRNNEPEQIEVELVDADDMRKAGLLEREGEPSRERIIVERPAPGGR